MHIDVFDREAVFIDRREALADAIGGARIGDLGSGERAILFGHDAGGDGLALRFANDVEQRFIAFHAKRHGLGKVFPAVEIADLRFQFKNARFVFLAAAEAERPPGKTGRKTGKACSRSVHGTARGIDARTHGR